VTTLQLGVWVCDLAVLPVEVNDMVHETKRDIKCVDNLPHCLPLVVVTLDNPLSQVRGICGDHGGVSEDMNSWPAPLMLTCSDLY